MRKRYLWRNGKWTDVRELPQESNSPAFYFSVKRGGYDPALGQYIGSAGDKRDALKRIKDETGASLVEVGNESAKVKKPESNYDLTPSQMRDVGDMLNAST